MNTLRPLSRDEISLISALLIDYKELSSLIQSLGSIGASAMDDGGMGSLSLVPKGLENTARMFGKSIAECIFKDADGVEVSLTINIDTNGNLFECDVWKTDFTPLQKWPQVADIQVL